MVFLWSVWEQSHQNSGYFSYMGRIVCIDYGMKRCGIAATDPLQIIVSAVTTVSTPDLLSFFEEYLKQESVEKLVVGLPVHTDGTYTYLKQQIDDFCTSFSKKWAHIPIAFADEQFSSVQARQIILQSGVKKEKRKDKALVDKVSAVLILQRYLHHI